METSDAERVADELERFIPTDVDVGDFVTVSTKTLREAIHQLRFAHIPFALMRLWIETRDREKREARKQIARLEFGLKHRDVLLSVLSDRLKSLGG